MPNLNALDDIGDDAERRLDKLLSASVSKALDDLEASEDINIRGLYVAESREAVLAGIIKSTKLGLRGAYVIPSIEAVNEYYLNSKFYGSTLSDRLYRDGQRAQRAAEQTLRQHIKNRTNWQSLTKDIKVKAVTKDDLPQYILNVQEAFKKSSANGEVTGELKKAINKANRQIAKFTNENGITRSNLKTAYRKVVKAAESGDPALLRKKMAIAINKKATNNSQRLARSELSRAYAQAETRRMEDDPDIIGKRSVLSPSHPRPDVCDYHAEVDAYGMGAGVSPIGAGQPLPYHARCVLGDMAISSFTGINKVFNSSYTGTVVKITTGDGGFLAVTQNHPVLTQRGWVNAISVRNTDYLVSADFSVEGRVVSNPNNYSGNATAYDISKSLMVSGKVMPATVPPSSEHFHSNGEGWYKNVNIINVDGLLLDDVVTETIDGINKGGFEFANSSEFLFSSDRLTNSIGDTFRDATDGVVGFGGDFGEELVGTVFFSPEFARFLNSSDLNVMGFENIPHLVSSDSVSFCNTQNGFVAIIEGDDDVDFISGHDTPSCGLMLTSTDASVNSANANSKLFSYIPVADTITAEFKNVVSVFTTHVEHLPVYNYETPNTNVYNCNGFVNHNCVCLYEDVMRGEGDRIGRNSKARSKEYFEGLSKSKREVMLGKKHADDVGNWQKHLNGYRDVDTQPALPSKFVEKV